MAYSSPSAGSVDFDLSGSYSAPAWDSVGLDLGDGSSSPGTSYSAPAAGSVDFDLAGSYAAPSWDAVSLVLLEPSDDGGDDGGSTIDASSGVDVLIRSRYGTRQAPNDKQARIPWGPFRDLNTRYTQPWAAPTGVENSTRGPWGPFRLADTQARSVYAGVFASWLKRQIEVPWTDLRDRDTGYRAPWPGRIPTKARRVEAPYLYVPAKDRAWRAPYHRVDDYRRYVSKVRTTYDPPAGDAVLLPIDSNYTAPSYDAMRFGGPDLANVRIGPRDQFGGHAWNPSPPHKDEPDRIPWGPQGRRDAPGLDIAYNLEDAEPADPPPLPPSKEVYLLMPSITAKRTSDDAEVVVNQAKIRTDRDSWAWQLDATLATREDLNKVKPSATGPVEIQITVNGRAWLFLIESHRRGRSFNSATFEVSGRSPSALLTKPYSAPRTFTETAQKSAAQLAAQELDNTGWTVNWNAQDWNVPANVWSYDSLTPVQAIQRLAEAVGAVVTTRQAAQTLDVEPYYPVSPWNWSDDTTAIDAALTDDITFQLEADWEPGAGYNAVWVSGKQGGVLVHVLQSNTTQDVEADMVVDELITERLAGRERGRLVLSEAGDRELVGVTTPLLPDPEPPGLLEPGQMVEVTEPTETWRAQVQGVTVTADRANATRVRQQLEIERYHGKG